MLLMKLLLSCHHFRKYPKHNRGWNRSTSQITVSITSNPNDAADTPCMLVQDWRTAESRSHLSLFKFQLLASLPLKSKCSWIAASMLIRVAITVERITGGHLFTEQDTGMTH